jgi:maltooligosyltrehalose trehalohydrolase
MGQEWAATSPFLYFTDHPPELGRLVTEGRREEFGHFSAFRDPEVRERIPDPQALETYESSKLRWEEREAPRHAGVLALYRELLALRRSEPALRERCRDRFAVTELGGRALALRRDGDDASILLVVNFAGDLALETREPAGALAAPGAPWSHQLDTEEARFGGEGEAQLSAAGLLTMRGPGAMVLRSGR